MAEQIRHRGPDDHGTWCDPNAGYAVAHRRLSILDLSTAGHQPMHSASGRWVLAYNGEIYNHLHLRRDLEAAGAAPMWLGHSDTETLLAGVEAWGLAATLKRSVGMFAFALWDREERTLWLARDRIGEKPLYYGWQKRAFLFGSELKALRAYPEFDASVDRGALSLLLRHSYVPEPYSIYTGIRKLTPGTMLCVKLGSPEQTPMPYWSLIDVAESGAARPFEGSDADALTGLDRRLCAAVRGQMLSDVPLGALLSGGVDSSLITALMQVNSSRPVRTFTIGIAERQYDESAYARRVASHLGTEHTELRLGGDEALSLAPHIAEMYDEPFADPSQLPTHLVMKLARAHVTVTLSGDAGDEVFGGYNRYRMAPRAWRWMGWMPTQLRRASGVALTALPISTINKLVGPAARRVGVNFIGEKAHKLGSRLSSVSNIDDLYVSLVSEWPKSESVVVGGHIPKNILDDRRQWPALDTAPARMMALDGLTYLPGDILVKADRASMAVSLETRAPMLDRDVVEFAWTLPLHMKLREGQGKWLLRQLLYRYVPQVLVDRPKIGFGVPLNSWLRGPLRDWCEALLAEERLRREGFFYPKPVRAAWERHASGKAALGTQLWPILMFQSWMETH